MRSMPDDFRTYSLPKHRGRNDAQTLLSFLHGARARPVRLDLSAVDRLDAPRLRILLSAQRDWAQRKIPFDVQNLTESAQSSLERLGLPATHFGPEVGA